MKTRSLFSVVFALILCLLLVAPGTTFAQEAAEAADGGIGAAAIAGILVAGLGMLVSCAAGIWLLVIAFTVHWGWGLACLFVPFAPLVFLIMNWSDTWKPFVANIGGVVLLGAGGGLLMTAAPSLLEKFAQSGSMEEMAANLELEAAALGDTSAYDSGDAASSGDLSPPALDEDPGDQHAADSDPMPEETTLTRSSIKVGESVARVRRAIGRPTGQIKSGDETILMYGAMTITARDGLVVEVTGAPSASDDDAQTSSKSTGKAKKKKPKATKPKSTSSSSTEAIQTIKNGGKRVDMKALLVPGKVTVVDFYADWCGPCVQMAPHLEALARNDADVVLRKVDIVNWTSDVAQQYSLRSIPNVRVYNRSGKQVGDATSSLGQIKNYIGSAK